MIVRRVLTDTPLARRHEHAVAGSRRRHPAIPWSRFDRGRYPPAALKVARASLIALARGEFKAVDHFSRLTSALAHHGAPLDLVAACAAIPSDEVRHSDLALRAAGLMGDGEPAFEIDRAEFDKAWPDPLDRSALDRIMMELPAVGETLALALLSESRARATDPVIRAFYSSIVSDELHHARLGWYYLAWRAPQWTQPERQHVANRAGELAIAVERQFERGREAPPGAKAATKALGVLDTKAQRRVIRNVMESEIVPGLDALGLGASLAWRVRPRAR